jgi:peptide/nickel transport system ATP-binding protein
MAENILSITNLNIFFQAKYKPEFHAIKNLSLELERGETYALVGESGSGKSVTSLAIMGLLPPTAQIRSGQIQFAGKNLVTQSTATMRSLRGQSLAMIFQEPMTSLNPLVPVGKQIMEPILTHLAISRHEARERVTGLLQKVGLEPPETFFPKYPHELSGGQQQRIMIAMAISCGPKILIADEPTTALDVTIQKQILELLKRLQADMDMTVLFITHDLGVVADIADRVGVMRYGELLEQGRTAQIFAKPNHPYTKGLIACRPPLTAKPRRLATINDFIDPQGQPTEPDPKIFQSAPKLETATDIDHPPILELRHVTKQFKKPSIWPWAKPNIFTAVNDVSLTIPQGLNFGLVGESGCGKTTLARMMIRLLQPDNGQILFKSQDIASLDERGMKPLRRQIQYIFQNPYAALNPRFTIEQILLEPMMVHGIGQARSDRDQRIDQLLTQVGLDPKAKKRYPHEFSGGQRQRICIARALSVDPDLIICDESVAALDVSIQAQILNLLLDLQEQHGVTYIFISHDLSVVRFFSDQIAVMKAGEIVEIAPADTIYHQPQHEFTQKLLDSIPKGIPKGAQTVTTEIYR